MTLLIDSAVLGTSKHLLVLNDGFSWVSGIPSDTWHFSGKMKQLSSFCWDTVIRLNGHLQTCSPPSKYVRAMETLAPKVENIPWQSVMPSSSYREYFNSIISSTRHNESLSSEYYETTWVSGNKLLNSLRPAKVDGPAVEKIISDSVHAAATASSFRPRSGGYAQPVIYDRFGTVTGRLTVESGPNILLLKKELRSIIKPSTPGGSIISIDFSSLEARILLYESGGSCEGEDLYSSISAKLGGIPRAAVKAAVLAELYGSSRNSLALTLGMTNEALSNFIRKVGEVIDTRKLLARLKSQFSKEGVITNKYGRRIEVSRPQDNIFINYYAQSTGVDVSLTGFNKVLGDLGTDGIRPLFILHDALILDVRQDRIKDVEMMKSVSVNGYTDAFPLKHEIITQA
jgi:hypothetical protein